MLKTGIVWQEETFKCRVDFSLLAFLCFLAERKSNNEKLLCQILRNFTGGNSRNLVRIFLFFHLKTNYVIRIGTREDRYVGMREIF